MDGQQLNVLGIVGSRNRDSVTRAVIHHLADRLKRQGCAVEVLDLRHEPLDLYDPDQEDGPVVENIRGRLWAADVILLGSPDYHGSISGVLKNFLDYFWHEFAGKLIVPVAASHEKGLTVIDQLRTIARQCYAWVLPYGISFAETTDVRDGRVVSESLEKRLAMAARDSKIYGELLARQRRADLACEDTCFMARHRKK